MPYDKRKQFGKRPSNIHDNYNKFIGKLNCFKVIEDGYCDWCYHKYKKENLWYSISSKSWVCDWCKEIRELELKIEELAKERHDVNNFKGYVHEYYPYEQYE